MNFKPAVETPVILMSQNREMFLMDHNPASVNNPTMSRTMNLLWAQISISRLRGDIFAAAPDNPDSIHLCRGQCVDAQTLKPNRERIEGLHNIPVQS